MYVVTTNAGTDGQWVPAYELGRFPSKGLAWEVALREAEKWIGCNGEVMWDYPLGIIRAWRYPVGGALWLVLEI